ncbi:MAG: TerB family tellurite resistance protein [Proteobacteria bacterium]|nr:TerB family tellurite resistance protein [Pseudomonadota bacterium]
MIDAIREFFRDRLQVQKNSDSTEDAARLAAAALLFEAAMSDYDLGEEERTTIQQLVREQFDLDDADASALATLAQQRVRESVGLHGFTSLINQHWSEKDRLNLVEQMWRVVYADGRLDDHELHLMRKIQRLLHIPQNDFVSAKLRHKPT